MQQAVRDISRWLGLTPNPGEAVVRQAIVLRLLQVAGFDIWNPAEVIPEETDKAGFRPDLRIAAGSHQIVLELKGMNVGLHDKDYQQVAAYAGSKGIRWALLSDGRAWVVIDEHLPGPYTERAILKLELNQSGPDEFAADVSELLNAGHLREGLFEEAVLRIVASQQKRRDVALIHKEKRPVVQATQEEFGISTFEKAAAAAAKMGIITEAERDVLTGGPKQTESRPDQKNTVEKKNTAKKTVKNAERGAPSGRNGAPGPEILKFRYRIGNASASADYLVRSGIWRIKAGSLALGDVRPYATGVEKRRARLLGAGSLEKLPDGRLRYLVDVDYSSPSSAAGDISGASKNGWDAWVDEDGRKAQHHRPND